MLRDSISWGRQAEHERREKEREKAEKEHERAEKERERRRAEQAEQALSRSIRHLRTLGHDADEIAGALSIDADDVRRVLADADSGGGSA